MYSHTIHYFASLLLLGLLTASCIAQDRSDAAQAPIYPVESGSTAMSELRIGSGDLLEVSVFGAPDYDRQVRVGPEGDIVLPMIGAIKVAGLPVEAAEELVARRLSEGNFFNHPQVSIFIKEYATQGVSVLGEVQKPGIYALLGPHTLLNAISAAGGTTPKAGDTATIAHSNLTSQPQTVKLYYSPDGVTKRNDVPVYPGDTILVSKAGIVYVVGDVHTPSGLVMDKPQITVLQALAMAQGVNQGAALNGTMLIRKTADGQKQIPVPLKKILDAKAPDFPLQPDDILFVPASTAKALGRKTLETAVQVATGVAIYRP